MLFRETLGAPSSLGDLLPWAALIAPGVILNKDGSLLAGWSFQGPDLDSSTPEELSVLSDHASRAFGPLGDGWAIHCDALRTPATLYPESGAFPDALSHLIDDERRSRYQGQLWETRTYLTLTYFPPRENASFLRRLVISDPNGGLPRESVLEAFDNHVADVAGSLEAILQLRRLDDTGLLSYLHACVSGLNHPLSPQQGDMPLDLLLASQDLVGGLSPRIGSQQMAVLGLAGLPLASQPGLLDALGRMPFGYRFSSRFLPFDPFTAERLMGTYRRGWMQQRKGMGWLLKSAFKSPSDGPKVDEAQDLNSLEMLHDLDHARAEAAGGEIRFGAYTANLLLFDENAEKLARHSRDAAALIRNCGIAVRIEDVNSVEAYLGSLPGHVRPNVRRPLIHTRNLAHLLPLTSQWSGNPVNPSPLSPPGGHPALLWTSTGESTFRFNLHSHDDVGHTVVIGPTGAGKSTFLASLMAGWLRYPRARVIAFDKGYSALPITWGIGGAHYDIGADNASIAFCPLAEIGNPSELAWANEWLQMLFELNGIRMSPDERRSLADALSLLSTSTPRPTLSDLWMKLQNIGLRNALEPYTVARAENALLDARSDELASSHFLTFEMSHLVERGRLMVAPTLLYLFHRIRKRLDGSPTLVVLDEAWTFLGDSLFTEWLRTALKEFRKLNACVVFATQSLADLAGSSLKEVLIESTATKVYLPNPQATNESVAPFYRDLGLNPRQLHLISQATPKRDYYASTRDNNRLFRFPVGPLELAFCGAGSQDDLATIRDLRSRHGEGWMAAWLRRRHLDTWATRLTEKGLQ
jgi:type IV secretion system protein TrbE